jgi:hypothetical protein
MDKTVTEKTSELLDTMYQMGYEQGYSKALSDVEALIKKRDEAIKRENMKNFYAQPDNRRSSST